MPDGEHFDDRFSMETWAKGHEVLDNARFESLSKDLGRLFAVAGAGIMVILGLCGWSLKANYDNADRQIQAFQALNGGYHGRIEPLQGSARLQPP